MAYRSRQQRARRCARGCARTVTKASTWALEAVAGVSAPEVASLHPTDAAFHRNATPITLASGQRTDDTRREIGDSARIVMADLAECRRMFHVSSAARVEVLRMHPALGAIRIAHATPGAALGRHLKRQADALIYPVDSVLDARPMPAIRASCAEAHEARNRQVRVRPDCRRGGAGAGRAKEDGSRSERGERPTAHETNPTLSLHVNWEGANMIRLCREGLFNDRPFQALSPQRSVV